jgi:glucose-1-phosphate cytidylyltransferase
MNLDGCNVLGFEEKPAQIDGYINGGFMVVDRRFISGYLNGDEDQFFEREPMTRCAADGQMQVFKHEGFWQCMDNQREYNMLNAMWEKGNAPWTKYWK